MTSDDPRPRFPLRALKWTTVAVQVGGLLLVLFGDFGFDRPGRFGFDFNHLVIVGGVILAATATRVAVEVAEGASGGRIAMIVGILLVAAMFLGLLL